MIGIRNPINEFVVAPRIVIAAPILGTTIDTAHANKQITNVQITFCLKENFLPSIISSSKESFEGRIQNGAAKVTITKTPRRQSLIIIKPP